MDPTAATRPDDLPVPDIASAQKSASHGDRFDEPNRHFRTRHVGSQNHQSARGMNRRGPPLPRAQLQQSSDTLLYRYGSSVSSNGHTSITGARRNTPTLPRVVSGPQPQIIYQPPRLKPRGPAVRHGVPAITGNPRTTSYLNASDVALPSTVAEFNAMPTPCDENLPRVVTSGALSTKDARSSQVNHQQTYQGHMYHRRSPPHCQRSFSRVTEAPPAAYYATGPPPANNSGHRVAYVSHHQKVLMPFHIHQYQHYDSRGHAEVFVPSKVINPTLPPTVHVPTAHVMKGKTPSPSSVGIDDISQWSSSSCIRTGPLPAIPLSNAMKDPVIPFAVSSIESEAASAIAQLSEERNNAAADVTSSPLNMLSSISTFPVDASSELKGRANHIVDGSSSNILLQNPVYPHHPPADVLAPNHETCVDPLESPCPPPTQPYDEASPSDNEAQPANASQTPKSVLPLDLILSAASTLESENLKEEMAANEIKRKRKEHSDDEQIKKIICRTTEDRFSVGKYPPGIDPKTLPPMFEKKKKTGKSRLIDPDTITQAQQASLLAKQALERPLVSKQLLLSMALVRSSPRTPPSAYPAHGTILTDRFHWSAFPPLDNLLRKNMKRYYELSTTKCQSRDQQDFNNNLVYQIKDEVQRYGWEFDVKVFDDKMIRHRIRCFFKIHIQNAKKRLKTMLRNPGKRANIKALAAHFHLIDEKGIEKEKENERVVKLNFD